MEAVGSSRTPPRLWSPAAQPRLSTVTCLPPTCRGRQPHVWTPLPGRRGRPLREPPRLGSACTRDFQQIWIRTPHRTISDSAPPVSRVSQASVVPPQELWAPPSRPRRRSTNPPWLSQRLGCMDTSVYTSLETRPQITSMRFSRDLPGGMIPEQGWAPRAVLPKSRAPGGQVPLGHPVPPGQIDTHPWSFSRGVFSLVTFLCSLFHP